MIFCAAALALLKAGRSMEARIAMIAITTVIASQMGNFLLHESYGNLFAIPAIAEYLNDVETVKITEE